MRRVLDLVISFIVILSNSFVVFWDLNPLISKPEHQAVLVMDLNPMPDIGGSADLAEAALAKRLVACTEARQTTPVKAQHTSM